MGNWSIIVCEATRFGLARFGARCFEDAVYAGRMSTDEFGQATKPHTFDPNFVIHLIKESFICFPKTKAQFEELIRNLKPDNLFGQESSGQLGIMITTSNMSSKRPAVQPNTTEICRNQLMDIVVPETRRGNSPISEPIRIESLAKELVKSRKEGAIFMETILLLYLSRIGKSKEKFLRPAQTAHQTQSGEALPSQGHHAAILKMGIWDNSSTW